MRRVCVRSLYRREWSASQRPSRLGQEDWHGQVGVLAEGIVGSGGTEARHPGLRVLVVRTCE